MLKSGSIRTLLATVAAVLCLLGGSGCSRQQKSVYLVATEANFPPFEFYGKQRRIMGFDIDFIRALSLEIGISIDFVDMPFSEVLHSVEYHKADLGVAGLAITNEREKQVNFSYPYFEGGQGITVRNDLDHVIHDVEDTLGDWICVEKGSVGQEILRDANHPHVVACSDNAECNLLFSDGQCDAIFRDMWASAYALQKGTIKNARLLPIRFNYMQLGIAVAKDNEELLEKINIGILRLQRSGKLKRIRDKWFSGLSQSLDFAIIPKVYIPQDPVLDALTPQEIVN